MTYSEIEHGCNSHETKHSDLTFSLSNENHCNYHFTGTDYHGSIYSGCIPTNNISISICLFMIPNHSSLGSLSLEVIAKISTPPSITTYVRDWTQLQILQISRFFIFSFKFNKFCDYSLNFTRDTKIRCLNNFSVRCTKIYYFMLIDL